MRTKHPRWRPTSPMPTRPRPPLACKQMRCQKSRPSKRPKIFKTQVTSLKIPTIICKVTNNLMQLGPRTPRCWRPWILLVQQRTWSSQAISMPRTWNSSNRSRTTNLWSRWGEARKLRTRTSQRSGPTSSRTKIRKVPRPRSPSLRFSETRCSNPLH